MTAPTATQDGPASVDVMDRAVIEAAKTAGDYACCGGLTTAPDA
ncbi:MAG: hypothetical protein AAGL24_27405 [Pseudomonadota bacterium]